MLSFFPLVIFTLSLLRTAAAKGRGQEEEGQVAPPAARPAALGHRAGLPGETQARSDPIRSILGAGAA